MSYATYDSYKDSGVDWLGAIPSDWEMEKAKWLFKKMERPVNPNDEIVTCFRDGQVTLRLNRRTEGFTNALKEHGYQGIRKGDLVIHQMDAFAGAIGISDSDGKSTPVYSACVPFNKNRVESKYYSYFLRNLAYLGFIESLAKGIRERSTDFRFSDFAKLMLPVPAISVQRKIVDFIDKNFAQIDQAIALKQQQIEKLNEYKQIVIQNAVTKGLNPNAPMKNSGVEWIGDVPEHWNVIRFRNAFRFNKGLNITKENLNDEQGILCLNYGEIHSKYGFEFIPNVHPLKFVDESYLKNNQKSLLNDGDFVFADTSEDIEGSGNFSYINGQDLVFAGYHTLIAKPKINFNSRFIAYVLDSSAFRNQVRLRVKGVKVFSITQAILKTTFIWLPTEQEQNEIVKYLDEKMQKFNNAKIAYQIQIDRLKEYKNILINQAVTGKIKI